MVLTIVEMLWRAVLKIMPEEKLKEMFQASIDSFVKKHFTIEELIAEGKDAWKLLKEKL